jgi:hypothetical protein
MNRRHIWPLRCWPLCCWPVGRFLITTSLVLLLASCGPAPAGDSGAGLVSPATTGAATTDTLPPADVTTTTAAAEPVDLVSTTDDPLGPWFSFSELDEASMLLHNQFIAALGDGDVERVRSLLSDDDKGRAEALCAEFDDWVAEGGPDSAWGGMTVCFAWTGERYSYDAAFAVPAALDAWIKQQPHQRAGLQGVMGDNALWWFGIVRSGDGMWAIHPGPRDTEYALTHTLAGLGTLVLEATPRPGVRVTMRLRQLPDSGCVSVDLVIENASDSVFTLAFADLALLVDGVAADSTVLAHTPSVLEVQPGETERPGNGWCWSVGQPTSDATWLTYTPSDPSSESRPWLVEATR